MVEGGIKTKGASLPLWLFGLLVLLILASILVFGIGKAMVAMPLYIVLLFSAILVILSFFVAGKMYFNRDLRKWLFYVDLAIGILLGLLLIIFINSLF